MIFKFAAALNILFFPCIVRALHSYDKQKKLIDAKLGIQTEESDEKKEKVKIKALIVHPRFLFGLFAQMICIMNTMFLAPNLSLRLQNVGFSTMMIGVAFALPAIFYALTCPFIYLLTQRFKKRLVVILGFVMSLFSMQMIGGSKYIFDFE